jgi:hypothetical protein
MALVNDCIGLRLSTIGDKTQKDKQKKTLQHEAKRLLSTRSGKATVAQHHPISGHPAIAEHPASSGAIEVKEK